MINFTQSPQERLQYIHDRITEACDRSHRSPSDITLLGASKGQSVDTIRQFLDLGLQFIGENYLQEAEAKILELNALDYSVQKHFIGHLQTNKVKKVLQVFNAIQSVDSTKLAREINKRLPQVFSEDELKNHPYPIFVEVNLSGDFTKSGCKPEEVLPLLDFIENQTSFIQCKGLMTISPFDMINESDLHSFFATMSKLSDEVKASYPSCNELSMGMSDDFEIAIEEGSTLVRIGTLLFGPRPKSETKV